MSNSHINWLEMNDYLPHRRDVKSNFLWLKTAVCLFVSLLSSQSFVAAFQQEGTLPPQWYGGKETCVICDDGTLWATTKKSEILCFRDGKWEQFNLLQSPSQAKKQRTTPTKNPRIISIIGGKNGMAFIETTSVCAVCRPNTKSETPGAGHVIATGSIHALLEKHGDLLRDNFSQPRFSKPQARLHFAFTNNGKIWCLYNYALHVFDGDVWHDATESLIAAGIRRGSMAWLSTVGDERVFLSNLQLRHDGGESLFGKFDGKNFQFTKAPHIHRKLEGQLALYDKEDVLWLGAKRSSSLVSADRITGQAAVRVPPGELIDVYEKAGVPTLIDASGNVWLTDLFGKKDDEVNIWRNGKLVQQLNVPEFRNGELVCDRPGSVYAETKKGLVHIVADGPKFDEFRIAGQVPYPEDWRAPELLGYSAQGWMVYANGWELHVRRLSGDQE